MASNIWRLVIIAVGAVAIAATSGTAVKAMIDDRGDPPATFLQRDADTAASNDAICIAPACDSPLPAPECSETGACIDPGAACTQTGCFRPSTGCGDDEKCNVPSATVPACEPGQTIEQCFPNGVPADLECLTLETFPQQIRCHPIACPTVVDPIPVPTLADPGSSPPSAGGGTDAAPPAVEVPPTIGPCPPLACAAEESDQAKPCAPVEPCGPIADCVPPPCVLTQDGATDCPAPPPCAPDERCLPPDCVISSDGVVTCPAEPPICIEPAPAPGAPVAPEKPCGSPGSCGDLGCTPVPCYERPELDYECAYPDATPIAGGSGGSTAPSGIATAGPGISR